MFFKLRFFLKSKSILFIFIPFFFTETVSAAVSCGAILSKASQSTTEFLIESLNQVTRDVEAETKELTGEGTAAKIIDAVQGVHTASEFSRQINKNLKLTLEALIKDKQRVYQITAALYRGGFVRQEGFDALEIFNRVRSGVTQRYKLEAIKSGSFLDIGLSPVEQRNQTEYTWEAYKKSYGLKGIEDKAIFWMYKTFLRENLVRFIVEAYIEKGFLKWDVEESEISSRLLLLAAYPEMIAFVKTIERFEFDSRIPFTSARSDLLMTKSRLVQDEKGKGSIPIFMSLWKEFIRVEGGERGRTKSQLSFELVKLEEVESISEQEFKEIANRETLNIKRRWDSFLKSIGAPENGLTLHLDREIADGVIDISVESSEGINTVELTGRFYLFLTR